MQRRLRVELLKRRDGLRAELQQVRTQLAANELWLRQHSILVKRASEAQKVVGELHTLQGYCERQVTLGAQKNAAEVPYAPK